MQIQPPAAAVPLVGTNVLRCDLSTFALFVTGASKELSELNVCVGTAVASNGR